MNELAGRFVAVLIKPAILLVFTAGFFMFIWGLVEFLYKLGQGGEHKEGKDHMLWGVIGMLIMVSVYGILNLLDNTFNLNSTNPNLTGIEKVLPKATFIGGK